MTTDLLSGPLAQAIGLALLHGLWQGAIVAGIVAALFSLVARRSAALRYAIACGGLAIVFLLAIATAWQSYAPIRVAPAAERITAVPDDSVLITAAPAAVSWQDRALALFAAIRAHTREIVVFWFAGVLILTIRLGVSWWRAQALARRSASAPEDGWQRAATRLAEALGVRRPVQLMVSFAVDVPSVVGWIRPVILLAAGSITGLTPEQVEMVLAHELAHIRRHDFLVNAVQSLIETLLFYNPAVWWLSRQIRIERENCCDDLAVAVCGDAVAYARALAQLETVRGVPLAAAAANGGSLSDRIRRLVGARSHRSLSSSGWIATAVVTTFVTILGFAAQPLFAEHSSDAQPQAAGTRIEVQAPKPAPTAKAAQAPARPAAPSETTLVVPAIPDIPEPAEPPEPPEPPDLSDLPAKMEHITTIVMPRVEAEMAKADAAMAAINLNWDFDEEHSSAHAGKLTVDDLIALKMQRVEPEYIEQMRAAGLGNVPMHQIVALHAEHVTPEYVRSMRDAGVAIKSARDLIALKALNVTPEYVRSLAAAGYDHLTAHDLVRLKAAGVTADYIREVTAVKPK